MLKERHQMSEEAYSRKLEEKGLSPDGSALDHDGLDEQIAPPLGFVRQPSMVEYIRRMVKSEHLRQAAEAAGAETFEEADDFDVGDPDDNFPMSPHELREFDPAINPTGVPSPLGEGKGQGEEGPGKPAEAAKPVEVAPPAESSPSPPKAS